MPTLLNTTVEDAVDAAFSQIRDLAEEIRETVDNASEAQSATQRMQTLGETCDALENYSDPPEIPPAIAKLAMSYGLQVPKTRAQRRDDAVNIIDNTVAHISEWLEKQPENGDDLHEAVQGFIDDLEGAKSEWEYVEFPGFGKSG